MKEDDRFIQWFGDRYGSGPIKESVFITCICGYYNTFPKDADRVLKRLIQSGHITKHNKGINING